MGLRSARRAIGTSNPFSERFSIEASVSRSTPNPSTFSNGSVSMSFDSYRWPRKSKYAWRRVGMGLLQLAAAEDFLGRLANAGRRIVVAEVRQPLLDFRHLQLGSAHHRVDEITLLLEVVELAISRVLR